MQLMSKWFGKGSGMLLGSTSRYPRCRRIIGTMHWSPPLDCPVRGYLEVICCQADSSLRPARGQWWNTSDLNRSDILSARQVATPSSPVSQIKCDFHATSKITNPLRPVESSPVLCQWRFPVSTRALIYHTQCRYLLNYLRGWWG